MADGFKGGRRAKRRKRERLIRARAKRRISERTLRRRLGRFR